MIAILGVVAGVTMLIATAVITWRTVVIWPRLDRSERDVALLCLALLWAFTASMVWGAWVTWSVE